MSANDASLGELESTGEDQLHAVISLVRGLALAARTGPHGPGRARHLSTNCDGCQALAQALRFLDAMQETEPKVIAQ